MTHPSQQFFRFADRQLDVCFRRVLKRIALGDVCIVLAATTTILFLRGSFLFALAPYVALLAIRAFLLCRALIRTKRFDVVGMYSSFDFHRNNKLRRHALLTRHPDVSHWVVVSYVGLAITLPVSFVALVVSCSLQQCGLLIFSIAFGQTALIALSCYWTIDYIYEQGVLRSIGLMLGNDHRRKMYASSRAEFLVKCSTDEQEDRANEFNRTRAFTPKVRRATTITSPQNGALGAPVANRKSRALQ